MVRGLLLCSKVFFDQDGYSNFHFAYQDKDRLQEASVIISKFNQNHLFWGAWNQCVWSVGVAVRGVTVADRWVWLQDVGGEMLSLLILEHSRPAPTILHCSQVK